MTEVHTITGVRTSGRGPRGTGIELARVGKGGRSGGTRASTGLVHSGSGEDDLQTHLLSKCG